ncbi:ankyrin repeat protein [Ancylostoma caninum]|uniref:Ankyrin repeat protein n=1 Tax=Ancylostoma caninum TaxID=29170 RepID=A0A368GKH6_ANCCA|nr:ankyrin repeat protein [Ancylostoma caninum]
METGEAASSPVYAVYFPGDIAKSPRNVFLTLQEAVKFANSPEGKSHGARFNRFGTPKEAMDFFATGESRSFAASSTPSVPAEPVIPHPSVSRIQMNDFKRAIEKGTVEAVSDIIETNPRFLVNTSGDTAAIVMEGFRFNALHIAARHGKADVVEKILQLVTDTAFLADLYGTSEDDTRFRVENIVASYLNTPDKGNWETPLHLAAKFGHVDVVRVLVDHPLMDRHLLNKEGQTALEIACARYTGNDRRKRKAEMELLLGGFFVALYRSTDNSIPPKIVSSESFPKANLSSDDNGLCSPILPGFKLSAYAGPFGTEQRAAKFLSEWTGSEKHVKLTDVDKGYERVGRELSAKDKVKWAESWCFLNRFTDLRTEEGLSLLNSYLGEVRNRESLSPMQADRLRRKLSFDDEEVAESPALLTPSEDEDDKDEEDEFEDALESIDEVVLNDSLASLAERMGTLSLQSPSVAVRSEEERTPPKDIGDFFTPPATPPPVFLLEHPTKVDNDVMTALLGVSKEQIDSFPHVRLFTEKLRRVSNKVRSEWPALDSPRRVQISKRFF